MFPLQPSARTLLCMLALLFCFSGGEVWAQDVAVAPGDRVRVWTKVDARGRPWGATTQGRLTAWTADSLVLESRRGALAIPRGSLSRMEIHRGRNPRGPAALKGAGFGLLIGAAAGTTIGLAAPGDGCETCWTPAETAGFMAALFAGGGVLYGGIIGALTAGERWERVPLPGRVTIAPTRQQGLSLSATLRF